MPYSSCNDCWHQSGSIGTRLKQKHHLRHHRKVIRATRGIVANGRSFDAERGIVTLFHKDVIDLYAKAGVAVGRRDRRITSQPAASRVRARFKPRKPVPPAITMRPDGFCCSDGAVSDIVIRFSKASTPQVCAESKADVIRDINKWPPRF